MSVVRRIQNLIQQYKERPEVAYMAAMLATADSKLRNVSKVRHISNFKVHQQNTPLYLWSSAVNTLDTYIEDSDAQKQCRGPKSEEYDNDPADATLNYQAALTHKIFVELTRRAWHKRYRGLDSFKMMLIDAYLADNDESYLYMSATSKKTRDAYPLIRATSGKNKGNRQAARLKNYPFYLSGAEVFRAYLRTLHLLRSAFNTSGAAKTKDLMAAGIPINGDLLLKRIEFDEKQLQINDTLKYRRTDIEGEDDSIINVYAANESNPRKEYASETVIPYATYFVKEDFEPSRADLLMPWLGKVINAWFKVGDKLRMLQLKPDELNSLPCINDVDLRKFSTDDLLRSAAGHQYGELVQPYIQSTMHNIVHSASMTRLAELLPAIIDWAADPKTQVDFLKLSVGEAARAAKVRIARRVRAASDIVESAIVFKTDKYVFMELTGKEQIKEEGKVLAHCLRQYEESYCARVNKGEIQLVSVRTKENKRIATIQLNLAAPKKKQSPQVVQVMSFANTPVESSEARKAIAEYFLYIGAELSPNAYGDAYSYIDMVRSMRADKDPEAGVLSGLWDLPFDQGIRGFVSGFGRR